MITDAQIQEAALAGLRDQLRIVLSRGECGAGKRLEELVTQTIEANQSAIESQVEKALMDALQSPEFVAVLRAEMLQAMTRKFAGTFDGVMRAAGKRAAQDRLAQSAIRDAVTGDTTKFRGVTP